MNLSSPVGATLADAQGQGTIANDDTAPAPAGVPVVWTSLVGATANGGSLTKTAATAWGNAGAISSQQLPSGDGYVQLTASETTTFRMLGLSNGNTSSSWDDIDFALYLNLNQVQVYEGGINKGSFGTYVTGDTLRVAVVGGVVRYSRNGTVFYSSGKTPKYPLLVDTALCSQGATLSSVVVAGFVAHARAHRGSGGVDIVGGGDGQRRLAHQDRRDWLGQRRRHLHPAAPFRRRLRRVRRLRDHHLQDARAVQRQHEQLLRRHRLRPLSLPRTRSKSTKAASTRAASGLTSPATSCASRWSAVWCGTPGTGRSSTPPRSPLSIRSSSTPRSTPRGPRSGASSWRD